MEDKMDEVTFIKNMNVYEKIQRVKRELSERELKKSGENKFSGFKYYELGDFMPSIIELCNKYGLFTQITFTNEEAILIIVDCTDKHAITLEDGTLDYRCVKYSSPMRDLELKGANAIQALGGVQTYLRRYLYMNAFDIVEADMFDSEEFEKKKRKKAEKGDLEILVENCKSVFKKADDKTKSEIGNAMKTLGYESFGALSKAQNKNDIISLATTLKIEIPQSLKEENKGDK